MRHIFLPLLYLAAKLIATVASFLWLRRGSRWGQSRSKLGSRQRVISCMLTHLIRLMNTCPTQQNMKHCHRGSTRQGAASNKLHSMSHWRWIFLRDGDINTQLLERPHSHVLCRVQSPHRARHAEAASGLRRVCLPLQCDNKQTQSNEFHCREPVNSTLGARRRGWDSHTVSCSQSVNKYRSTPADATRVFISPVLNNTTIKRNTRVCSHHFMFVRADECIWCMPTQRV